MTYTEVENMKIGELLKEYRLKQNKSQREFIGSVVTQSYYSKVEKDNSQISVKNLIDLLHCNSISVQEFFSKFDKENNRARQQLKEIENMMIDAYYANNIEKMHIIKKVISNSELDRVEQEKQILMVDGFLAVMDPSLNSEKLTSVIKNKIFDIPSFNKDKLVLYCDFMRFYSLEANEMITRNILREYQDTSDTDIQELVLAIVCNILIFSIEKNDFHRVYYFYQSIQNIKTIPKLIFYKMDIEFFENIIEIKTSKCAGRLDNCRNIIKVLRNAGMQEYSNELKDFMKKNL